MFCFDRNDINWSPIVRVRSKNELFNFYEWHAKVFSLTFALAHAVVASLWAASNDFRMECRELEEIVRKSADLRSVLQSSNLTDFQQLSWLWMNIHSENWTATQAAKGISSSSNIWTKKTTCFFKYRSLNNESPLNKFYRILYAIAKWEHWNLNSEDTLNIRHCISSDSSNHQWKCCFHTHV